MIDTKVLREKILDLAMRGKLVPQDPNDEPASELLKRIKAEKEELIKQKKIKRDKNETEIFKGDDGLHYEKFADGTVNPLLTTLDFPDNWLPIKLSQILRVSSGKSLKRTQLTEDGNVPVYGAHGIMGSYSEGFIEKGTLLIGRVGFYAGSIMRTKEFSWVTDNSLIVSSSSVVNSNFLELSLKHLNLGSLTSQTAQPVISGQKIYSQIIFLPPVNEQTKIVDSYNELISKVNTIEKEQEQLKQLATQLKQKVLDVAMQGKLVPQDPNDEPASVLLEKIRAEKQRLYEEGKIKKKDLVETEIVKDGDNAYYQNLPDSWEIVPLKNIVNYRIGKTPNTKNKNYWTNHEGFPWISIADMGKDKYIGRTTRKITNKAVEEVFKGIVSPKGTLIMSFKLSIGKTNLLGKNSVHNEAIISIFPYWDNNNVLRNYLYLVLPIISNSGETISAIKGKTLNSKKIDVLPIPLPTIREQQEINTKVMLFLRILEIIS